MKIRLYLFFAFVLSLVSVHAQIYTYTNDSAGNYSAVASNATGQKLTRHNGAVRPVTPCTLGFSSDSFTSNATYASTLPCVEADVAAVSGYQLSVTGFSVGLRRSNTGPADAMLAYSIDGGATWTSQGTVSSPNNAGCGTTTTFTWITALTVTSANTLKFRVYGYGATGVTGTMQILNLNVNGTVTSGAALDSIHTTAAAYGPFCSGLSDTVSVAFTSVGAFTGLYNVQLSDSTGVFPGDAVTNIISTGSATSPVTAVIPSGTTAGSGYRVRVVDQTPTYYTSSDNGSAITILQSVRPAFLPHGVPSTITLCPGSSYTFDGNPIVNGGSSPSFQWFVNGVSVGTDSTYTITSPTVDTVKCVLTSNAVCAVPSSVTSHDVIVTSGSALSSTVYDTLCPGATLVFGTQTLSSPGVYADTFHTGGSCDSIVTLHLAFKTLHTSGVSASFCQGGSYTFNGNTYSSSGTFSDTIRCDSIVILTLSYIPVHRTAISASFCQGSSYSFNGINYTSAGTYNDTIRCDSIVSLTLSYIPVQRASVSATFCQGSSYPWNGQTYTTAGTYSDTVRCDSIATLTLSYKPIQTTNVSGSVCPSVGYTFGGHTYTTPGTYRDTVRCDSIVVLTLSANTLQSVPVSASICQGSSYTLHGSSYTLPGTYNDTINCDSLLILTLSFKPVHTTNITGSVCPGSGYAFGGHTYTTAGTYADTVRCDSIVILTLSAHTAQQIAVSASICPGDNYILHGTSYTVPGTYNDTINCDSIMTLTLTYKTVFTTNNASILCPGDSFVVNGHTYAAAGTYTDTVRCDSIAVLTVSYKPLHRDTLPDITGCVGDQVSINGHVYTTAGTYSDTVRCDSIVTYTIVLNPAPVVTWTPTDTTNLCNAVPGYIVLTGGTPGGGVYSGVGVVNDTFYYSQPGVEWITYTYHASLLCYNSDSARFHITICPGIIESLSDHMSIYPNPTENMLHIEAYDLSGTSTLTLTDMIGQELWSRSVSGAHISEDIDISAFSKGLYQVAIRDDAGHSGVRKIVKD